MDKCAGSEIGQFQEQTLINKAEEAPQKEARERVWKIMGNSYQNLKWKGGKLQQLMAKDRHLSGKLTAMRERKGETL